MVRMYCWRCGRLVSVFTSDCGLMAVCGKMHFIEIEDAKIMTKIMMIREEKENVQSENIGSANSRFL